MSKFKEGDKVLKNSREFLVVRASVESGGDTYTLRFPDGRETNHWWHNEDLTLVERRNRSMSNLQAGDILVNDISPYDYDLEVQGVIGKAVITTRTDEGEYTGIDSATELKDSGWKLKDSDPEIIEFTLAELAEKLNIPLEVLRIKE